MLGCGITKDLNNVLHFEQDEKEHQLSQACITKVSVCKMDRLNKKYNSLGWKFKTLKVSFLQSGGDFTGMLLNFPYYAIQNHSLTVLANRFFANPDLGILCSAWNAPASNPVVRFGLELISTRINTKREIFFRKYFPHFTFDSVQKPDFVESIKEHITNFSSEMAEWDIFAPRKRYEEQNLLKATVLCNQKMGKTHLSQLPVSAKANKTVILYLGGGGFVADLQLIQEKFLKQWVKNTDVTIYQMHYGLAPKHQYPAGINDAFNLYMQIVLYHRIVMNEPDTKFILMGDSAGGKIALSVMNLLGHLDMHIPHTVFAIYPVTDFRQKRFTPSMVHSFDDQLLYFTVAKTCAQAYVGDGCPDWEKDWLLSPVLAPPEIIQRYPQTILTAGEKDTLRDDNLQLVYKVKMAGKSHAEFIEVEGLYHGFLGFWLPLHLGVNDVTKFHDLVEDHIKKMIAEPVSG